MKANGAVLQTALKGATIKVKVRCWVVILNDNDPNARNPIVVQPNLNKGNKQIGTRHQPRVEASRPLGNDQPAWTLGR